LVESDEHKCPSCGAVDQSPDGLTPNKFLRTLVTSFINDTSYLSTKKPVSSAPVKTTAPAPPPTTHDSIAALAAGYVKTEPSMTVEQRKHSAIPSHLIGMPPQVIRAAMDAAQRGTVESMLTGAPLPSYSTRSGHMEQFVTSSSGYIPRHSMRMPSSVATSMMHAMTSGSYVTSHRMSAPLTQHSQILSSSSSMLNSAVGQSQSAPSLIGQQHHTEYVDIFIAKQINT